MKDRVSLRLPMMKTGSQFRLMLESYSVGLSAFVEVLVERGSDILPLANMEIVPEGHIIIRPYLGSDVIMGEVLEDANVHRVAL